MALIRSSHKVFKIKYHVVFCIKYRKDLFLEEKYVETVKQICKDLENRFYLLFETIGFDEDHVHFLIELLTTTYSPAKVFQVVKSISARELYHGEFWSDGGYVGTIGEGINGDIIRNYIKNQGRKDSQLRLINFVDAP